MKYTIPAITVLVPIVLKVEYTLKREIKTLNAEPGKRSSISTHKDFWLISFTSVVEVEVTFA